MTIINEWDAYSNTDNSLTPEHLHRRVFYKLQNQQLSDHKWIICEMLVVKHALPFGHRAQFSETGLFLQNTG